MTEPRQCCFISTLGYRCKVIKNLNRILILEPDNPVKEKWGCYEHVKIFIKEQCDDIDFKLRQLDFLKNEIEKSKNLDILHKNMAEVGYESDYTQKKVEDKRTTLKKKIDQELKELRNNTCRNILCRKPITSSDVKYAVEIRTHYNNPRLNIFYHRMCITQIKASLGFILPIHKNQFTLDQTIRN